MPSEVNPEELERAIVETCERLDRFPASVAALFDTADIATLVDASRAHLAQLRAPKDDLASAKAELGAWALEHPGETWQHFPPSVVRSGHQARVGREYGTEQRTKARAVLDALTKARATGGDRG